VTATVDRGVVLTSGAILAIAGIAKIWTAANGLKFMRAVDPIFGVEFGHLFLSVGLLELVVAGVCLLGKREKLATVLVAWLATNFLVYRLGLWWMDWKRPCGCLGNLTDALRISPQTADNISKVLLAYLLVGSYGLLLRQWRQQRYDRTKPDPEPDVARAIND
jgi:hypothetical protein